MGTRTLSIGCLALAPLLAAQTHREWCMGTRKCRISCLASGFPACCPADSRRVVYGHQDFEYELPGSTRASFLWRPYMANLTAQMHNW